VNLARVLGAILPAVSLLAAVWFAAWAETARRSRRHRKAILTYLRHHPDVSTAHLARRLRIPYSSTFAALDTLEAAGRVARYRPYTGPHTWHTTHLEETGP
jgi:predicted ArsR family transcriptional regulator